VKLPPFVQVDWNDAASSNTTVFERGRDHKSCIMKTRGWVVADDDVGVTVASEYFEEEGVTHWRGWTFVPRGMVRKITTVRPKKTVK
jgi:hypothetical protein